MIAQLTGTLIAKQPPRLLIDVGGVGYELESPMSSFYTLPEVGQSVSVLTHLSIRDDAHILYGFASEDERSLFRGLIKVNGVGPKMALAILSSISVADFAVYVQNRDASALTRLPGIGNKTAQRLVIEMQDRLSETAATPAGSATTTPSRDAVSALVALGYKPADAEKMVKAATTAATTNSSSEDMDSAALIREALKTVVR